MLNKMFPFPWGLGKGGRPELNFTPTMGALSPSSAAHGSNVTLPGTNLGPDRGSITINGVAAPIVSWTPTKVVFTVPAQGAYPDTHAIVLTTKGGVVDVGPAFTTSS